MIFRLSVSTENSRTRDSSGQTMCSQKFMPVTAMAPRVGQISVRAKIMVNVVQIVLLYCSRITHLGNDRRIFLTPSIAYGTMKEAPMAARVLELTVNRRYSLSPRSGVTALGFWIRPPATARKVNTTTRTLAARAVKLRR